MLKKDFVNQLISTIEFNRNEPMDITCIAVTQLVDTFMRPIEDMFNELSENDMYAEMDLHDEYYEDDDYLYYNDDYIEDNN